MSQPRIHRVTMFKVSSREDRVALLEMYKKMPSQATKNGKPYIVAVEAGETEDDQRRQGYTLVAKSTFESKEDFDYYDKECEAHKKIKALVATISQGFLMVYFTSVV